MDISSNSMFVGWENLGTQFDIIYEGIKFPTKMEKTESEITLIDNDRTPSGRKLFELTVTDKDARIEYLQAVRGYRGTFVLGMLIQLCKYVGMKNIRLEDIAGIRYKNCEYNELSSFKMLTEGQTYYGKHGRFEADVENIAEWKADCARLVKQFQEVKLADYIANLRDVINFVSKHDTIFTQTIDIKRSADMVSGVLSDKSIIEKYETIIKKCSASNQEYLYQYMIDIMRSTDYLELESTLYSGPQIYSFSAEDGTKICREYVKPAATISAMVMNREYILAL